MLWEHGVCKAGLGSAGEHSSEFLAEQEAR